MSLILFDFDGVLADTLNDLLQFGQEVCDELGVKHTATAYDLSSLEVMSFATYGRQLEVPEALIDEFVRRSLEKVAAKKSPPAIFAGLADVVRKLSAKHVLGIVTTNSARNVNLFLAEHGLEDCFRVIHGIDSPGSKTEKILKAREQFSNQGEDTFMIGDSMSDIRSAKEASVQSIAVSWGHQSLERLVTLNPDYVVRSPMELLKIFEI
ncbi:MAG: HAD family hydrolase [Chloroflexi bacterium]|nr:HAD family hydrolase [Chloroflexota bacterium]